MKKRLEAPRDEEDKEAEKSLLDIIDREKDRLFCTRLNFVLYRNRKGCSIRDVNVKDENKSVRTCSTQKEVE